MTSHDTTMSNAIEIRPYQEGDEAAVVALWREAFPDAPSHNCPAADIRRKLDVQRDLFLVAVTAAGDLVGSAMAGYDGHRGWVYYVAVRCDHRQRSIGRALMRRVEQDLAARGCPKVNLQVRAGNEAVVAFYRRLGYDVEERVSMGKRLPAAGPACVR
ncbi:MAG: GNAT family acetyltransferase [Candidatus Eiseniibacteriota bacterium]|jgi:ribosomal protein S18 acetylase RimI-like enzyme